jgi:outer membrane immunogenic protein
MRRILLASVFVGLATAASAADLVVKARPAPTPARAAYDWSGFYIGGHAGYAFGDSEFGFGPFSSSHDVDGYVAGIQTGINWQFNQIVLGVEGALSFEGMEGSSLCDGAFSCNTELDHFWRAGVRVGVTGMGIIPANGLLYGMGGFARAKVHTFFTGPGPGELSPDTRHHHGFYLGAGYEYALSPNLIIGIEGYHVSLGDVTHSFEGNDPRNVDLDFSVVQGRVSYKFDYRGWPISAR